jgi:ABC-type polysaccharide/polyol phosphate transport system ATPase subunit
MVLKGGADLGKKWRRHGENSTQKITIEKFRALNNVEVEFGDYITVICRKNGTPKSSILGIAARSSVSRKTMSQMKTSVASSKSVEKASSPSTVSADLILSQGVLPNFEFATVDKCTEFLVLLPP